MPTTLRCNLSYQEQTRMIIVNFMSESNLFLYSLGQKIMHCKSKGVGTFIKILVLTLMEDEQENTIQQNKTR